MALLYYRKRAPVKSKLRSLLSHRDARAGPSALEGLTSVFGMGTGVTPRYSRRYSFKSDAAWGATRFTGQVLVPIQDLTLNPGPSGARGPNDLGARPLAYVLLMIITDSFEESAHEDP